MIEEFIVSGMGHGTPLDVASGVGATAPYMLDVGISSTHEICRFWGIDQAKAGPRIAARAVESPQIVPKAQPGASRLPGIDVGKVIEDALRSAGLMR